MKRLLFGNPGIAPLRRVRFIRINRYKDGYYEPRLPVTQPKIEILLPPRGPSWAEKEGLLSPSEVEWEQRSRRETIGRVAFHWFGPHLWSLYLGRTHLTHAFGKTKGTVRFLGITFWRDPSTPKPGPHISRKQLREWMKNERPFL